MDEMVLEAQEWLNSTYSWHQYYIPCDSDGIIGQGTMKSFICALQIALGVNYPDGDFGPQTMNLVESYGNVGPGHDNPEMCNFVRYGLWCKGYPGGHDEGVYSATMVNSVYALTEDMGLPPTPSVEPKTLKALFSTDAYVVVSGGTEKIREIQQWMNGQFYDKIPAFFIAPCDGHFTRSAQQAYVMATQYAVGTPADEVDGIIGPATRSRLASNTLSESKGSTGNLVWLFTAGCVFNEGFVLRGTPYTSTFRDEFNTAVTEFVEAFQEFSALGVNGTADMNTWAQLLSTPGNPDRSVNACDCASTITQERAQALHNAGYRAVGRYLDEDVEPGEDGYLGKALKGGELGIIFDNGLRCFPIWQYNGRYANNFTWAQGYSHGQLAVKRAEYYGFKAGTCIYFAVDFDAVDSQITSNIIPYFNGVRSALKSNRNKYVIGVYGSRNVCSRVIDEAYARWAFVSGMSWGFDGNLGHPLPQNWAFNQIKETADWSVGLPAEHAFDLDSVAHRPNTDFGVNAVGPSVISMDTLLDFLYELESVAESWRSAEGVSRSAGVLMLEYLKENTYGGAHWDLLFDYSVPTAGWIDHAIDAFGVTPPVVSFQDPQTGVDVMLDHWAAAACGRAIFSQDAILDSPGARAAFAGWLGDLSSFYGEWQGSGVESGSEYCAQYLARADVASKFPLGDLIEDIDGLLLGKRAKESGFVAAIENYYVGGGYSTRFDEFISWMGGNRGEVESVGRIGLVQVGDVVGTMRNVVIVNDSGLFPAVPTLPGFLPEGELDDFLRGYSKRVADLRDAY